MSAARGFTALVGLSVAETVLAWTCVLFACLVMVIEYRTVSTTIAALATLAAATQLTAVGLRNAKTFGSLPALVVPCVVLLLVAYAASVAAQLSKRLLPMTIAAVATGAAASGLACAVPLWKLSKGTRAATTRSTCSLDASAWIINLDRDDERWRNVCTRLAMTQVATIAVERFPAVDARRSLATIRAADLVSADAWRTLPTAVGGLGARRSRHSQIDVISAIGCTLSHYGVWQRIVERGVAFGLVLEDDVLCDAFVLDRICDAVASLRGTPWDVLLVGYAETPRSGLRAVGLSVAKIDDFIRTHCYVVSRGGALKLAGRGLPDKYPITQHIDAQLSAWTRAGVIDVYACTESFAMSALHSGQDHGPVE